MMKNRDSRATSLSLHNELFKKFKEKSGGKSSMAKSFSQREARGAMSFQDTNGSDLLVCGQKFGMADIDFLHGLALADKTEN